MKLYQKISSLSCEWCCKIQLRKPERREVPVKSKDDFKKELDNYQKMVPCLQLRFKDTLTELMNYFQLTNRKLAELSSLGEKTVSQLRKGVVDKPQLETIIAICVALQLPTFISHSLIETAGYKLQPYGKDIYYQYFLDKASQKQMSIEYCNDLLIKIKEEPLTKMAKELIKNEK